MNALPEISVAILEKLKIKELNPMQVEARSKIMEEAEVVLLSPTGTGKTLAFLLPVIENIDPNIDGVQALIIVPTRELAVQIEQVVREMGSGFKVNAMYGGRSGSHDKINLKHPPSILIGTPGRLAANIFRETFEVAEIKTLVLDEFDKSLEMGYDDDMIDILDGLPSIEKKILTSATFGVEIPDFVELSNPQTINYLKDEVPALSIEVVKGGELNDLLLDVLSNLPNQPGIIFCNYKDSIQSVCDLLQEKGIPFGSFYGDMDQQNRERALLKFRNGTHQLLVATDLAARGIDIPDLKFIVHYQLPKKEEEFTHRNGRTARMKKKGTAYVLLGNQLRLPDYLEDVTPSGVSRKAFLIEQNWVTLFISGGRQDKISKGDIAGLLMKEGKLSQDEVGIIELKRDCAFVAVNASKAEAIVTKLNNSRLKKKKVRIKRI
jgi:superfamily II DNA/RNA helicase